MAIGQIGKKRNGPLSRLDDDRPIIGKLFLRSLEFILGLVRVVQGGVLEFRLIM